MNKVLSRFLMSSLLLCGFAQASEFEEDKPTILPFPEVKEGKIERAYRFSTKVNGEKHYRSVMILEDGYTLYNLFKKDDIWAVGDEILIQNPYQEDDGDEVFVDIENTTQGKKTAALKMGWTLPSHLVISEANYEKNDEGDKSVTITLEDGSKWCFTYFDECAHAKHWRKGDRVLLIINTLDGSSQNPFPGQAYLPEYEYNLVNLNIKRHAFAGEPAKLLQENK